MHADSLAERSLLKTLRVGVALHGNDDDVLQAMTVDECDMFWRHSGRPAWVGLHEQYMLAFEPLIALRPALKVEEVNIAGIPAWSSNCLEMALKGEGGVVDKTAWPMRTVRRRVEGRRTKKTEEVQVTTKIWRHAVWDWRAFAAKNGVEVPVSASSFFEMSQPEA
jgi:hypothetical protein